MTAHTPTHQSPIFFALAIGFLIGVVVYSVLNSSVGFLTLIPLYLIFRLLSKPKQPDA